MTEDKRSALFHETPSETLGRVMLGAAWALKPSRLGNLAPMLKMRLAGLFTGHGDLPDVATISENSELAGIARDLSVPTLMDAYRRGLFPHGHVGSPKWLSPVMRGVVRIEDFHISSRLRATMRQGKYTVTFDRDFDSVIKACAGSRPGQWHLTWITPRIMHAYARAFDQGHVHSFEVWNRAGELVGGGYGVAVGRVFVIESMFFRESNASKIGFSVLAWHLAKWGFVMCDNKWLTGTTAQMGFRDMKRSDYLQALAELADASGAPARWELEMESKAVADWRPAEAR